MASLLRYINPAPSIGGLEVSDLALRYLILEDGKPKQASVQLPPGVIVDGKITDREKLIASLGSLHRQIAKPKKIIHAVLIMPASVVYTQFFSMPQVAEKNLKETAQLNLKMISPIDPSQAYFDYQLIGEAKGGQVEALGAFISNKDVDDFLVVLRESNFDAIAVEFTGLSLMRLIKEYSADLRADVPYLVMHLAADGPDILIVKSGHLYFSYFHSWAAIQNEIGGRKLEAGSVLEFMMNQAKQVLNFYTSKWGGAIKNVAMIQNPLSRPLTQAIKKDFGIDADILTVGKFNQLTPIWYGTLGAALRGRIPRGRDKELTLTGTGVDVGYYRQMALNFISGWRNIALFVLGFVAIVFGVSDVFLIRTSAQIKSDLESRGLVSLSEIQALQSEVQKFNRDVSGALAAQELSRPWSPLYDKILANIRSLTGQNVKIDRLYIDQNLSALMIAKASNDSTVINFKNLMAKEVNFQDVVLPLSNIKVNSDGTVSFTLQFKIKGFL